VRYVQYQTRQIRQRHNLDRMNFIIILTKLIAGCKPGSDGLFSPVMFAEEIMRVNAVPSSPRWTGDLGPDQWWRNLQTDRSHSMTTVDDSSSAAAAGVGNRSGSSPSRSPMQQLVSPSSDHLPTSPASSSSPAPTPSSLRARSPPEPARNTHPRRHSCATAPASAPVPASVPAAGPSSAVVASSPSVSSPPSSPSATMTGVAATVTESPETMKILLPSPGASSRYHPTPYPHVYSATSSTAGGDAPSFERPTQLSKRNPATLTSSSSASPSASSSTAAATGGGGNSNNRAIYLPPITSPPLEHARPYNPYFPPSAGSSSSQVSHGASTGSPLMGRYPRSPPPGGGSGSAAQQHQRYPQSPYASPPISRYGYSTLPPPPPPPPSSASFIPHSMQRRRAYSDNPHYRAPTFHQPVGSSSQYQPMYGQQPQSPQFEVKVPSKRKTLDGGSGESTSYESVGRWRGDDHPRSASTISGSTSASFGAGVGASGSGSSEEMTANRKGKWPEHQPPPPAARQMMHFPPQNTRSIRHSDENIVGRLFIYMLLFMCLCFKI
jgi:hypothetical protein